MPNPEFAGNVPRMRCETCKSWSALGETRFGFCTAAVFNDPVQPLTTAQATQSYMVRTTDLTVCSNWTRAE